MAAPTLDALAATWADVCQLAERHVEKLVGTPPTGAAAAGGSADLSGLLMMLAVGRSEEARDAAQPTTLPRGGPGQTDVGSPSFAAWDKERRAGEAAVAAPALLAAAASQVLALEDREPAPALRPLFAEIRAELPPVGQRRSLGAGLGRLADRFGSRVVSARRAPMAPGVLGAGGSGA